MGAFTPNMRIGFAIINGAVVFQEDGNRKGTLDWMKSDLGLSADAVENTIRGGVFESKITLCIGADYKPVDMREISAEAMLTLMDKHYEEFGDKGTAVVYNGSVVGEPGVEWEPIEVVGRGYFLKEK